MHRETNRNNKTEKRKEESVNIESYPQQQRISLRRTADKGCQDKQNSLSMQRDEDCQDASEIAERWERMKNKRHGSPWRQQTRQQTLRRDYDKERRTNRGNKTKRANDAPRDEPQQQNYEKERGK